MTKILALDSSSDACSVALIQNGAISDIYELAAKSHTQRLLPMVDELLTAHQLTLADLDAIAFGRGPGSFTGLRICMGVVQGLAFGANLPVLPISTLQAMAQAYMQAHPQNQKPLLVAIDARMDEVYWCLFSAELIPQRVVDEAVAKPVEVAAHAQVKELGQEFVALGSGWHYSELGALTPAILDVDVHPNAKAMVQLAATEFEQGRAISILEAQPVYLRDSVSWQKRQRIRTSAI